MLESPHSRLAEGDPTFDVEQYLREHEQKELVRFVTVGSVDDGKSTLIGRLLYEAHGIYEDQLAAVVAASAKKADHEIDYSLFTDGLRAEREQGITIDVAYRYFSTKKRKFIIADTPGHVEYTRNMATGASTADIAIILLDARLGVLPQSRRHAAITSLLGIRELVVCVNKMDLVGYTEKAFRELLSAFSSFVGELGFRGVHFVPVSAKLGDNVVGRGDNMPWYEGPTLLGLLETLPVARDHHNESLRFPVQLVLRPHLDYRGFAGTIAEGVVRVGDAVEVLPSRRKTRIEAIDTFEGSLREASAPMSVTLRLEDEVDVSRGDMIVAAASETDDQGPMVAQDIEATLVWLSERPFDSSRRLLLKQTTRVVPTRISEIVGSLSLETLALVEASGLGLNDIVRVRLRTARPLFCDPYVKSRVTGAFVLIDALQNGTVAAGMIVSARPLDRAVEGRGSVTAKERAERLGHRGAVVRVPSALWPHVERMLFDRGILAAAVRAADLGRDALVDVAHRLCDAGLCALVLDADDLTFAAVRSDLGEGVALDVESSPSPEDATRLIESHVLAREVVVGGGGI